MNPEFLNTAPAQAREQLFKLRASQRNREFADALDFIVYGDEDGRHAETCVHAEPCAREYDPLPYPEALPAEPRLYEGTGIGALYGLPETDCHLWQLAGWNLVPRSSR